MSELVDVASKPGIGRMSGGVTVNASSKDDLSRLGKLNTKGPTGLGAKMLGVSADRPDAHSRNLVRDEALQRAFRAVGGQSALALLIGRSKQATWHWRRVPATFVLKVEELTGISRYELRPDLYPREERQGRRDTGKDVSRAA